MAVKTYEFRKQSAIGIRNTQINHYMNFCNHTIILYCFVSLSKADMFVLPGIEGGRRQRGSRRP